MGEELTVEILKQLPLATVAIIACITLWRYVTKRMDENIADLQKQRDLAHEMRRSEIADLRARVMVIEDNLHISRNERFEYLPTVQFPEKSEMKPLE